MFSLSFEGNHSLTAAETRLPKTTPYLNATNTEESFRKLSTVLSVHYIRQHYPDMSSSDHKITKPTSLNLHLTNVLLHGENIESRNLLSKFI